MVKLVGTLAAGAGARKSIRVRVSSSPHISFLGIWFSSFLVTCHNKRARVRDILVNFL